MTSHTESTEDSTVCESCASERWLPDIWPKTETEKRLSILILVSAIVAYSDIGYIAYVYYSTGDVVNGPVPFMFNIVPPLLYLTYLLLPGKSENIEG